MRVASKAAEFKLGFVVGLESPRVFKGLLVCCEPSLGRMTFENPPTVEPHGSVSDSPGQAVEAQAIGFSHVGVKVGED